MKHIYTYVYNILITYNSCFTEVPILVRYMAKVVLRKVYFMEMEGSAVRSTWCSSIEH